MKRAWLEANRRLWDDRVPIHVGSEFYGLAAFKAGAAVLHDFELQEVGEVAGKSLVHLQCHFGMDTLGWARQDAQVTGLDFSEAAIEAARSLAAELDIAARFETADVYDAVAVLGERYDAVYTGRGALIWLPDLSRWARVVAELLRPGGFLYLTEFHPLTDMFADDSLEIVRDYFGPPGGYELEDGMTYAETGERTANVRSYEWNHPLASVVGSLLDAGLQVDRFTEYPFTVYRRFPFLECEQRGARRIYRMPEGHRALPLMYSIKASKPVREPAHAPANSTRPARDR